MEAFLALDLVQRCRRRIDIEQRHVRLAVLADAIGEGLQAPIFVLGDFAAHLPDDTGQLRGQFFDLLRAQILARKVDVFVQRHECLSLRFKSSVLDPGAKPLEPFGERLECSEGGSTGRRAKWPYRLINCAQPAVRSAPNQDRRSARFIGGFLKNARQTGR